MPTPAQDDYLKAVFGVDVTAVHAGIAPVAAKGDPAAEGTAMAPKGAAAAGGKAATFAKARMAWIATRQKVERDIGQLHGAFNSAFAGHARGADLGTAFKARADKVLDSLDEALAHKLDEVTRVADPAQHAKLVDEARQIIQRYEATLASDATIAALDANPFAPLAIRRTMTTTLSVLSKAIA